MISRDKSKKFDLYDGHYYTVVKPTIQETTTASFREELRLSPSSSRQISTTTKRSLTAKSSKIIKKCSTVKKTTAGLKVKTDVSSSRKVYTIPRTEKILTSRKTRYTVASTRWIYPWYDPTTQSRTNATQRLVATSVPPSKVPTATNTTSDASGLFAAETSAYVWSTIALSAGCVLMFLCLLLGLVIGYLFARKRETEGLRIRKEKIVAADISETIPLTDSKMYLLNENFKMRAPGSSKIANNKKDEGMTNVPLTSSKLSIHYEECGSTEKEAE